MALESFSGIWSLNTSNPTSSDDINQGDDHLRGIKQSLKQTFPSLSATVNVSASEINHLSGVASNIQNTLQTFSASLSVETARVDSLSASLAAEISRTDTLSASLSAEITRTDTLSASLSAQISRTDTLSASLQTVISQAQVAYGGLLITTPGSIFSASASAQAYTGFDSPMPANGVTVGTGVASLTPSVTGIYSVAFSFSFSGDASQQFDVVLYKDNAATRIGFSRLLGASSDIGAAGANGLISANASSVLALRVTAAAGGDDFTPNFGQFHIHRISGP